MPESRKGIKNPILSIPGRKAAWYLFEELVYPTHDFEKFRRILWAAVMRSPWLYKQVIVPKRSGKKRILQIPDADLKIIQERINKYILKPIAKHANCFGFSGGGIKDALSPFLQSDLAIFTTDVKDAFPSTSHEAVFNFFRQQKYGYNAAFYLTVLTTWQNNNPALPKYGLPQGAPTSPRLFDLCFVPLDDQLAKLAGRVKGNYSRYADNIFFSAPDFWPETKKKIIERSEEWPDDPCDTGKTYIKPAGQEDIEKNGGTLLWHAPIISAIYSTVGKGYCLTFCPGSDWDWNRLRPRLSYRLHKSYFARKGTILHALGLNLINGELHNTREFKRRIRMTIFNLKKALEQKDDFETKIWPLYLQLDGLQRFAIKETMPKLWDEAEHALLVPFEIRYFGEGGTRRKKVESY